MNQEFRYKDGKVLGTQPHSTCRSAFGHCVLRFNFIKGSFYIVIYTHTHTHTNIHLATNMASIISKTLTYIYHGNSHQAQHTSIMHIILSHPRQQTTRYHKRITIDMVTSKKHVIAFQKSRTHHPTKHVQLIIKYISNACSCGCMTYLTYLTASQHLCINEWTCECMFIVLKQEKKKKTLIQHVKDKQTIKHVK